MKKMNSLRTRSFRAGGYSVVATLIVLALLIAVNVIMEAFPTANTKLDATATKIFSISEQTKNVLKTLEKDVTLYWICQESYEDATVETLLDHYATGSAHIKIEKLDPDVTPGLVEQYTDEFYNNSVLVQCGDRTRYVSYTDIYVMDSQIYYATGEEVWNFEGEDALTRSIYYVVTDDLPKAYCITGHGETLLTEEQQKAFADENVELAELKLVSVAKVPEDADMLFCYLPTTDLSADEKTVLQEYMAAGGKLLLITGPTEQSLPNLESVFAQYGVGAVNGMVVEGDGSRYSQYPYGLLPVINEHEVTNPVIQGGQYVLMPYSHGLTVTETGITTLLVTKLLTTTDSSYAKSIENLTDISQQSGDVTGPFCVGVAIEDAAAGTQAVWYTSEYILQDLGGNRDLFFNAVNWMCQQQELIAIRGKDVSQQILNMNEDSATTMTWIVVAIIPLAYLVFGISTYIRRKRR